ncbi:MAG: alpha/beta hydrolase [Candidatus Omnitrophota bacterium]
MTFLAIDSSFARSYYEEGLKSALKCALENGFNKGVIQTGYFTLTTFSRIHDPGNGKVRIYIEGDGSAWIGKRTLSTNPTPKRPMVLQLAALDDFPNVVYLGRPCQYTDAKTEKNFDKKYWSTERFSREVMNSTNEAIDRIKADAGADSIEIVGFSGGAAIAVILTSWREDVSGLITIAGNVDHVSVNSVNKVDQLTGSLNPIDFAHEMKNVPQRHFAAEKDRVIPLKITENFVTRTGDEDLVRLTVVRGTSHSNGWVKRWKDLLEYPLI